MTVMENGRTSFDKLRTRGNLRGNRKILMLSLSKHAQCRSRSLVERGKMSNAIAHLFAWGAL